MQTQSPAPESSVVPQPKRIRMLLVQVVFEPYPEPAYMPRVGIPLRHQICGPADGARFRMLITSLRLVSTCHRRSTLNQKPIAQTELPLGTSFLGHVIVIPKHCPLPLLDRLASI